MNVLVRGGCALCLVLKVVCTVDFNYRNVAEWPDLFPVCGGEQQSPIDIPTDLDEKTLIKGTSNFTRCPAEPLPPDDPWVKCLWYALHYKPVVDVSVSHGNNPVGVRGDSQTIDVGDNGHTINVVGEPDFGWYNGGRRIGRAYLKQFHFHFPSEHKIDGHSFAGEMHLVHVSAAREVLVVAVLFEIGPEDNPFLERLGFPGNLPLNGSSFPLRGRESSDLMTSFESQFKGQFFRYDGSLTTPPCTEAVHWIVLRTPALVSQRQRDAFKRIFPDPANARPTQKINDRKIVLDSLILLGAEDAPACPQPSDNVISIHGCASTCRVMGTYLNDLSLHDPQPSASINCPDVCPIQAPCTFLQDVRCIVGSDVVQGALEWQLKLPWSSSALLPRDQCSFYMPTSQPDGSKRECANCKITACDLCKSKTLCSSCIMGFYLSEDSTECIDSTGWMATWFKKPLLIVACIVVTLALIFLCALPFLKDWQPERMEKAIRLAALAKPREFPRDGRRFSWCKFWQWHCDNRAGIGIMLFFNFYVFAAISSLVFGLIHWHLHISSPQLSQMTGAGFAKDNQVLRCALSTAPVKWLRDNDLYREQFTGPMLRCSFWTWLAGLSLSFFFAVFVKIAKRRFKLAYGNDCESMCTLQIEGLPCSATVREIEEWAEELVLHVSSKDGDCKFTADDVIGASMCYHIPKDLFGLLKERERVIVDNYDEGIEKAEVGHTVDERHLRAYLVNLQGSGCAYVVFSSAVVADKVRKFLNKKNSNMSPTSYNPFEILIREIRGQHLEKKHALAELSSPLLDKEIENNYPLYVEREGLAKNMRTFPLAIEVEAHPESIVWENFAIDPGEERARIKTVPGRILLSIFATLMFFIPTLLFFSKNAKLAAAENSDILFRLKTQVLAAIYASSYNVVVSTAMKCAKSFGPIIRDGEDIVSLNLVVLSLGILTAVNLTFTMYAMVPAFLEHMQVMGKRPTDMDAGAETLFRIIFPSLIMVRYFVEPGLKYCLPYVLNHYVLPRTPAFKGKTDLEIQQRLHWPEIHPVWPYADVIVNSSLCGCMFFLIAPQAWELNVGHSVVLMGRYAWLTVAWSNMATKQQVYTDKLFKTALSLWGIPTGFLAAALGTWWARHKEGLSLVPLGLPNGPNSWTDEAKVQLYLWPVVFFIAHFIIYNFLVRIVAKQFGACLRSRRQPECIYEETKANSPSNHFNTNLAVVFASRHAFGKAIEPEDDQSRRRFENEKEQLRALLPKSVRNAKQALMPFMRGKEYQQGAPFDKYARSDSVTDSGNP